MTFDDCKHTPILLSILLASAGCATDLWIEGGSEASTSGATGGDPSGTAEPLECVPPEPDAAGWVHVSAATGTGRHQFDAVAIDASGDIYAAGFSSGGLMLPGMSEAITSSSERPIVAKFDCAGELLWIAAGQASGTAQSYALILSGDGQSVYVGGESSGALELAGAAIEKGAYVLRLDAATGAAQASVTLGGGATVVNALALGVDGTVYAAGGCQATRAGILVAELSPNLEMAGVRCTDPITDPTGGDVVTEANSVAVLADGDLIVGGRLAGNLEGVGTVLPSGGTAGFVARLETPLLPAPFPGKWFMPISPRSSVFSRVSAVAVLDDGTVVAGGKGDQFDVTGVGGQPCGTPCDPVYPAAVNAYVARLDATTGACTNSLILCSGGTADNTTSEDLFALVPTADGLYVTGQFSDSLVIHGKMVIAPQKGIRMFAARLTPELTLDEDWLVSSDQDGDTLCITAEDELRSRVYGRAVAARGGDVAIAGSACGSTIRVGPQAFDTEETNALVARLSAP